jgi:hypothetical protein
MSEYVCLCVALYECMHIWWVKQASVHAPCAQAIAKSGSYAADEDGVDDELDEDELQHEIEL